MRGGVMGRSIKITADSEGPGWLARFTSLEAVSHAVLGGDGRGRTGTASGCRSMLRAESEVARTGRIGAALGQTADIVVDGAERWDRDQPGSTMEEGRRKQCGLHETPIVHCARDRVLGF